jgi:two-component system sensor histidine kinase KdpD
MVRNTTVRSAHDLVTPRRSTSVIAPAFEAKRTGRRPGRLALSGEVLAVIAHELRAPLASLVASSEALTLDIETLERPQIHAMATSLYRRSLSMQALVDNLLCVAVLNGGRLRLQRQWIDLLDLIDEAQEIVDPLLAQRGQTSHLVASGPIPRMHIDRSRLTQVLTNLLINASKYGRHDSEIEIEATVDRQNHTVRINVRDRGPGIDESNVDCLFEPFRRSLTGDDPGVEGVGLGLAIVKAIVDEHGGYVGAVNRAEGGACFWLDLPIWRPVRDNR